MKATAAVVWKEEQALPVEEVDSGELVQPDRRCRFPFDRLARYCDPDEVVKAATDAEGGAALESVLRPG